MAKKGKQISENRTVQDVVQDLLNCYTTCMDSVRYCVDIGGKHAEPAHLAILLDCADICQVTSSSMFPGSASLAPVYNACADVCDKCAASCSQFDDEQMRMCADMCRKCAESCRSMTRTK